MSEIQPYISPHRRSLQRQLAVYQRKIALISSQLERLQDNDPPPLTRLLKLVAIHTDTDAELISGRKRHRLISDVRCLFIHIAIEYGHSKSAVAHFLNRDHSTIIFSYNSFAGKALEKEFRTMAITVKHNVAVGLNRQPSSRKSIALCPQ